MFIEGLCNRSSGISISEMCEVVAVLMCVVVLLVLVVAHRLDTSNSAKANAVRRRGKAARGKSGRGDKAPTAKGAATNAPPIVKATKKTPEVKRPAFEAPATGVAAVEATTPEIKKVPNAEDDEELKLCMVCLDAPRDAAFAHMGTAHVCCCFACATKVHETGGGCPVCRVRVEAVLQVYVPS